MRVLIAEDEDLYASLLRIMFWEMDYDAVEIVSNSDAVLNLVPTFYPDLMLLDIHIEGGLDGIQVAEKVHETNPYLPVIFITARKDDETYKRARNARPYAFLTKPFDEKLLSRTIELAFQQCKTDATLKPDIQIPNSIFLKVDGVLKKVLFEEIGYIEANDKYVEIVTKQRKFLVRYTMHEILEKLPKETFLQASRSHIINKQHVTEIDTENSEITVFMQKISFSKRNKQDILKKLTS